MYIYPHFMKYQKPKITHKKIKVSSLLAERNIFGTHDFHGELLAGICFLPQTKILMNDRTLKNIEQVKIGDKVFAYDIKTGSLIEESVIKLFIHPSKDVEYFVINKNLKVTGNHPVWANDKEWTKVEELQVNDWLLDSNGKKVVIKTIEKKRGEYPVYNLGLDGPNNNYFSENILVHNRSVCPCGSTCNTQC